MGANPLLAPIATYRVTEKQPVREQQDELDVDRCAALHNTLMLYGWIYSGKKLPDMQKKSWWSKHGSQSLQPLLRPAVKRYLTKIFDVPAHNFFYHVSALARPPEMLQLGQLLEDPDHDPVGSEKYRFVVLYTTNKSLVKNPAGIVYDQQTNRAILMPTYNHVFNLRGSELPWQRLESILSAFVDMIEGEKAVAVPDSVGQHEEIATPLMRHSVGARVRFDTRPWAMQPYTLGDLVGCLEIWKKLVETIEKRAEIKQENSSDPAPLCTKGALTVAGVPRGFAFDLLMRAQNSQIWFIAPGIRLPKVEEFVYQPFKTVFKEYPAETEGTKMPFLFLRCPGDVSGKEAGFRFPFSSVEKVPCGLYLDAFPNAQNPFEDACRFVLPIRLGGNKFAKTSDGRPIRRGHSELYQTGNFNPYVMRHGPKLVAILESWLENVESGHWQVNDKGVTGGIGLWRQADTKEDWWRYQAKHLSI